jgi:hypothetical protein
MVTFEAVLELGGKTATGIRVPATAVEALGAGKRVPVAATLAGRHTYRTTVAPYGGEFFIPVSAENRTAAGLTAGDLVEVTLVVDTEERTVDVPPELDAALDDSARARFEKLSYTRRKEMARAVREAKAEATRDRRIAKILEELA